MATTALVVASAAGPYTITASAGPGGTISPSGAVTVLESANQTFTITPNRGYVLTNVLVDSASVGATMTYVFTNVTADHTISATFAVASATGGGINEIPGYRIHTFSTNGTFTPNGLGSVSMLAVGGGGGGGYGNNSDQCGGGGGAGGFVATATVLGPISRAVTVGSGGTAGTGSAPGGNGGNSVVQGIVTAFGGGGGATGIGAYRFAGNGGSGGGAAGFLQSTAGSGTAGPPRQGYDGGSWLSGVQGGSGGGGATAPGTPGTGMVAGDGGAGRESTITGTSVYYAGGGGGGTASLVNGDEGTGGIGGGGNGGQDDNIPAAQPGVAGRGGGGGGGGGGAYNGAVGGSGIVVMRYEVPTYTITASAGPGGSISPSGTISVNHGSSQSFAITPNSGYSVANVVVDGSSVGAVSSYTFTNVMATHTISATFQDAAALEIRSSLRPSAAYVRPGQSRVVDGFTMRILGGLSYTVSSITIDNTGTLPASVVSSVSVYRDDGNASYGVGDTLLNSVTATFSSPATATFDAPESVTSAAAQYWVVYGFVGGASNLAVANSRVATVSTTAPRVVNSTTRGRNFTVDALGPTTLLISPESGDVLTGDSAAIAGTASDPAGSGVVRVEVLIRRSDGSYWSGSEWVADSTWRTATGAAEWYSGWVLDPGQSGESTYTVSARAVDRVGNTGSIAEATDIRVDNLTQPLTLDTPPPHLPTGADTDTCAMCHRGHTSASGDTWSTDEATPEERSSMLVGVGETDVDLCFTCHGIEQLGSGADVETEFLSGSGHLLASAESSYGPSPKECSDCHDSHGSARMSNGMAYPALLRAWDASKDPVYAGEEYCAACHTVRSVQTWDGLAIWQQVAHSRMATPSTGTAIRCVNCHEPHGSAIAPTIRSRITPPAAPATASITANDRKLCLACHNAAKATWAGSAPYVNSSHALSTITVAIPGEWPDEGAARRIGECQVCHNPMGEDAGAGTAVPKMLRAEGTGLCFRCHAEAGPGKKNIAALSYPASSGAAPELVGVFGGWPEFSQYGRALVYTQDATGTPPRALLGPRVYQGMVTTPGASAWGNIDGLGGNELLIADLSAPRLGVLSYDPLRGLSDDAGPGVQPVSAVAHYLGVGDVLVDGTGLPEVVTVNVDLGELYVYRYSAGGLSLVQPPIAVGAVSGLAVGSIDATPGADIVLTRAVSDEMLIATQDGSQIATPVAYPTKAGPCAPSIGDAWAGGGNEIVIGNAGEATATVSVFRGSALLGSFEASTPAGSTPTATLVANALPGTQPAGTSGLEVLVAYSHSAGAARLEVFPQDAGTGLGSPLDYDAGTWSNPSGIASGDLDADGRSDTLLATAGRFTRDATRVEPSLEIWRPDVAGTALLAPIRKYVGGAELAGGGPSVLVADLGAVGPSRHPLGTVSGAHVSTETASAPRHVECVDCHNSHQANPLKTAAPEVYGRIRGTWGVSVRNNAAGSDITYTQKQGIDYEYELCLKCHSAWSTPSGSPDIASQVNTRNASMHAVEAPSPLAAAVADTFEGTWATDSMLYCTDCHTNSASSQPVGPHTSARSPILKAPYTGTLPGDSGLLCYGCHKYQVYYTGSADTYTVSPSLFHDQDIPLHSALHAYHTMTLGFACFSCHVSHGSPTQQHMLRADMGYLHDANGGSCAHACHTAGARRTYLRP